MRTTLAGVTAAAILVLTACGTGDEAGTATATAEVAAPDVTEEQDAGAMTEEAVAGQGPGTIVEVASQNEDFSTLVTAIESAGLVETLNGEGPFTVFAPTDAAFDALPEGVLDALLLPENSETLTQILTYHVVPGEVPSTEISDGDVATVQGEPVKLSTTDGVMVNDATVVTPDLEASNGIIHVIDQVLLPPGVDPAALVG